MLSTSSNIVSDFQRIWSQPAKETIYNVPFQRNSSNRFHLRNCKLRVWNLGWNWSSDAVTQSTRPLRCYSPWPITNSRRTAQESITLLTFFLPQNYYVIDNLTNCHILWTTTFTSTHWTTFFGEFYSVSFFFQFLPISSFVSSSGHQVIYSPFSSPALKNGDFDSLWRHG